MKGYYFGCFEHAGHFWWDQNLQGANREMDSLIVDGVYAPPGPEIEGLAQIVYLNWNYRVWTLLAFWDRSIDKRGKCNSVFLLEGTLTFDQVVKYSRSLFPTIWQRFQFKIIRWPLSIAEQEKRDAEKEEKLKKEKGLI
jgi:hypothetical protein